MRGYIFAIDVIIAILVVLTYSHVQFGHEIEKILNFEHKVTQICYALQVDENYDLGELIQKVGVKGIEYKKMRGESGNLVGGCKIIHGGINEVKVYG